MVTKSSAPASKELIFSSSLSSAVTITTGTNRVVLLAFSRRHSSSPSMRGIWMSTSARSGGELSASLRAVWPSAAVTTSQPEVLR